MILGDYKSRTVWLTSTNGQVVKQLLPDRSQKLRNHSPTGFNWGYAGSGPAQLALALLLHYLNDDDKALQYYQRFKEDVIMVLPQEDFNLNEDVVIRWLRETCP